MPVVGCPKCKQKFQLPAEMVGKTIKCTNCKTAFKTAGQKAAGQKAAGQTKPPAKSGKPKRKPAGAAKRPAKPQPARAKDDLFGQPIPSGRGPDPLGNFSLEDPGFADMGDAAPEEDAFETTPADKKHLLANPALKAAKSAKKTKRKERKSKKERPKGFIGTKILGNIIMLLGGISILTSVFLVVVRIMVNVMQTQIVDSSVAGWVFVVGWGCCAAVAAGSLIYWPLALANKKALGKKLKVLQWEIPVWAIMVVAYVVLIALSVQYKKPSGHTQVSVNLLMGGLVAGGVAMVSYVALIFRVTQRQYKNIS